MACLDYTIYYVWEELRLRKSIYHQHHHYWLLLLPPLLPLLLLLQLRILQLLLLLLLHYMTPPKPNFCHSPHVALIRMTEIILWSPIISPTHLLRSEHVYLGVLRYRPVVATTDDPKDIGSTHFTYYVFFLWKGVLYLRYVEKCMQLSLDDIYIYGYGPHIIPYLHHFVACWIDVTR